MDLKLDPAAERRECMQRSLRALLLERRARLRLRLLLRLLLHSPNSAVFCLKEPALLPVTERQGACAAPHARTNHFDKKCGEKFENKALRLHCSHTARQLRARITCAVPTP